MVIVARVSFPRRHVNEAVTIYTGLPPLPPGITKNGPFFQAGGESVHVLTFYDVRSEEAAEALAELRKRYRRFEAIPDLNCDFQGWREYREFLAGWVE